MADLALMEEQVRAWRASGLTAERFSAGKGFSASGLRGWAFRLRRRATQPASPKGNSVRMVRVEREALSPTPPSGPPVEGSPASVPATPGSAALQVETYGIRIAVAPGFDPAALAAVLDVVEQRAQRRGRPQ